MTTTPLDSDGIMKVHYTGCGVPHVLNLRINFSGSYTVGTDPLLAAHDSSANDLNSTGVWDLIKVALKTLIKSDDHLTGWEVWDMQTTPPTWVFAGSESVAGTGATTNPQVAKGVTVVFLDTAGKKVKHIVIGTANGDTSRILVAAGSFVATWVAAMLAVTGAGVGNYISGRSAHPMLQFRSATIQTFNATETQQLWG